MASLKNRVFVGTMWMASITAIKQALALIAQIALARLLLPHDYGVASLVMTIDAFAVVLSSAGVSSALIQRKDLPRSVIDASAVAIGSSALVIGAIVFVISPFVSGFYNLPEITFLLRLLALDIFLKVMGSLYDSLMMRDLRYRALSLRNLLAWILQLIVTMVLAYKGFGPLSLVVGYLTGSLSNLLLCAVATRYIPKTFGDLKAIKGIYGFGVWVLIGQMVNRAALMLDQMIIAKVLNVATLGLFNVSKSLTRYIPNTFLGFVGKTTFPVFSRWQNDITRIESAYWRGIRINMMMVFPLCALIGMFSYQILAFVYGAKWINGEFLMKLFAIQVAIISIDAGYSSSVINATGRPRYGTIVMFASLLIMPGAIYLGSHWDYIGVAIAMIIYSSLFLMINLLVLRHLFKFNIFNVVPSISICICTIIPMVITGKLLLCAGVLAKVSPPSAFTVEWFELGFRLIACAFVCLCIYIATAWLTMKNDANFIWAGIRDAIIKRRG